MQPFFITSSGTDVGKTHVVMTLCWQLRQKGKKATALKPVLSGYRDNDDTNDAARILKSSGLTATPELVKTISPWQYRTALAPNMAAPMDGKPLPKLDDIVNFCRDHTAVTNDVLLVEGVGGIMVPLNDSHTVLDWMQALNWPVILVVGSYLGTISHTLTAVEVLKQRGLSIRALVVNESPQSDVRLEGTVATFEKFVSSDIPIVKLPRSDKPEAWQHMPLISWIVDA